MTDRIIIDANSLGHYANNGPKLTIGSQETQAIFGFLRNLRETLGMFSTFAPVVTWDGASWRTMLHASYKANRDKADTKAEQFQQARKDAYKSQVPHIRRALRLLGIPQVFALNMEADDLGAILTDRYASQGRVMLYTGDKDWLQLVGPRVIWKDFANKRLVSEKNFAEMTGCATVQQFIQVKALAGDQGDHVPGVGGLGEKGAKQFLEKFGSFENFMERALFDKDFDLAKEPKKHRDLVEDEKKAIAFAHNLKLVDLRTPHRPAPQNLTVDPGEPDLEAFRAFCEEFLFQSFLKDLEGWVRPFPKFRNMETA